MAKIRTLQDTAIKLVKNILIARRNGHIGDEQAAYDKLTEFCDKNNLQFDNVFDGARAVLRKSIANQMNGFC